MDDLTCLCRHAFWEHKGVGDRCERCACGKFVEGGEALPDPAPTLPPLVMMTECSDCAQITTCSLMADSFYRCSQCIDDWLMEAKKVGEATPAWALYMKRDAIALPPATEDAEGNTIVPPDAPRQKQEGLFHVSLRLWGNVDLLTEVMWDIDSAFPLASKWPHSNIRTCTQCGGFYWHHPLLMPSQLKALAIQCDARLKVDKWVPGCGGNEIKWVPIKDVLAAMRQDKTKGGSAS